MTENTSSRSEGRLVAGKYQIESKIGSGAMGAVYRARQLSLNRTVALKVLKREAVATWSGVKRFMQEAKLLTRLSHPNVVPVYDVEFESEEPYIAMEFVEGPSLQDVLDHPGQFPRPDPATVARDLAGGLAYVHSRGVFHRDIKPANILLKEGARAMLADFGLARGADSAALTTEGFVVGTPAYLAPEQLSTPIYNERTDLYQLGLVLYEAITSKPFFSPGADLKQVVTARLEGRIPDLVKLAPEVSGHLSRAVMRCLAKDPALRFQSADELVNALGRIPTASAEQIPVSRTALTPARSPHRRASAITPSASRLQRAAPLRASSRGRPAWLVLAAGLLLLGGVAGIFARRPRFHPAAALVTAASLESVAWSFEPENSRLRFGCKLSAPVLTGYRIGSKESRFPNAERKALLELDLPYEPGAPFEVQALRDDEGPALRWTQADLVGSVRELAQRSRAALETFWKHTRLTDQALADRLRALLGPRAIAVAKRYEASRRLKELLQRELHVFGAVQDLLPLAPLVFDEPSLSVEERLATYKAVAPLAIVDAAANAYGLELPWGQMLSHRMGRSYRQVDPPRVGGMNSYAWLDFNGKELLGSGADLRVPAFAQMSAALVGAQFHFDSSGILKIVVNDVPLYFDLPQRYYTPKLPIPVLLNTAGGKTSGPAEHGTTEVNMATLAHAVEPSVLASGRVRIAVSAIWIHPPTLFERNRIQLFWMSFPVR